MDINKSGDQLIVRVGKACNFKCNFCNVSDNESHVKLRENIDDIVRNFHYKLIYTNLDTKELTVTISGGEPSIFQKETIFALKYIKSFLIRKNITPIFEIQTNASNIDMIFAKILKENGIFSALVSFHTIDKNIFDETLGVSYDTYFHKIIDGISNLNKAGIKVYTNTIMSNQNKNNFYDTIKFLENNFKFINDFNIGLIQPHGEATKNLFEKYPRYEEIISDYNKSLYYLKKKGKIVVSHFVGPPACYIGKIKESLEVSENTLFRRNFNFSNQYLINNINDSNKIQTTDCDKCLYNNVCSGIWKEYVGLQKLKPLNYKKLFLTLDNLSSADCYIFKNGENIKKIYDKNIRHIIFKTSTFKKEVIYEKLKEATKIGFYKITLYIDSNFELESSIFLTGVNNIQSPIQYLDIYFINSLKEFSIKYSPQFRIDLDLFINCHSKNTVDKLKEIKKQGNNQYINLYNKFGKN